jgi:hypothetical protein
MEIQAHTMSSTPRREPWNKGRLIGSKRRTTGLQNSDSSQYATHLQQVLPGAKQCPR